MQPAGTAPTMSHCQPLGCLLPGAKGRAVLWGRYHQRPAPPAHPQGCRGQKVSHSIWAPNLPHGNPLPQVLLNSRPLMEPFWEPWVTGTPKQCYPPQLG